MAINWPNLSPKTKSFTKNPPASLKSNYSGVPFFVQTTGVRPGQAPVTGHTTAPAPSNMMQLIDSLPGLLALSVE